MSTNIARESPRDSAFDVYDNLVELVDKDFFLIFSPTLSGGTHIFDTLSNIGTCEIKLS